MIDVKKILKNTENIGWGFHDALYDTYAEYYS